MLVTLEAIETAGPGTKARRLVFSDHVEPRTTSAAVIKALGLEPGAAFERETLERQLVELEPEHARERALRMLGYRDRTESELRRALATDGYPAAVARAIVDRLAEVELVDDERFAAAWVRSRTASGIGPRRITRELAEKGVSEEIVQRAMEDESPDDAVERARRVLRGVQPATRQERDKALRKLIARGFDMRTALDALSDQGQEDDSC